MSTVVEWGQETAAERDAVAAEAARLSRELKAMGAVRVVLFGSRASGAATRGSDLDLIAIMPSPPPGNFPERLLAIYEAVRPRVGADILVYTPAELARVMDTDFGRDAMAGAVDL